LAFQLLDPQNSGRIRISDLREALEDSSTSPRTRHFLSRLPPGTSDPTTNTWTWDDFVDFWTHRDDNDVDDPMDDMKRMFRLFDPDDKGYIDLKDLKRVANELGERMTDGELQEMIDCAIQLNDEGSKVASKYSKSRVTLEDFTSIMNKKLWT
jgi:Ca2+-binding EF-hand superfamily protein